VKTSIALAFVVLAIASYFTLALVFGVYQLYPLPHYALALAGCVWLAVLLRRNPGWLRGIALGFAVLLTALYFWYTLSYSMYDPRPHRVGASDVVAELPGLTLLDHDGEPTPVLGDGATNTGANTGANASATLLVFYRGFW